MTVKLTDAQLMMLSAASQREDLCLTASDKMKGAVLSKVSEKLAKLGLVREVRAKAGTPVWRRESEGATIPNLIEATGWLPHTTRAALTGLRKRGYAVVRQRVDGGESIYRIASLAIDAGERVVVATKATPDRGRELEPNKSRAA